MKKLLVVVMSGSLIFAIAGCKKSEVQPQMPAGHPSVQEGAAPTAMPNQQKTDQMATAPKADNLLTGKVTETMNSGGYTYVSLEKNGKKIWAAMPMTPVKVGQELTLQPGAEMRNFSSKTLNRTFESIIFSAGVVKK